MTSPCLLNPLLCLRRNIPSPLCLHGMISPLLFKLLISTWNDTLSTDILYSLHTLNNFTPLKSSLLPWNDIPVAVILYMLIGMMSTCLIKPLISTWNDTLSTEVLYTLIHSKTIHFHLLKPSIPLFNDNLRIPFYLHRIFSYQ